VGREERVGPQAASHTLNTGQQEGALPRRFSGPGGRLRV
jgi:hypothetical protein